MSQNLRKRRAKRPDTWMPFFIGDYLADTLHLTRDQHGGYILLLFAYWRRGSPLPDDDAQLAATAKAQPSEWRKLRPVLAPFFQIGDGVWRHKRVDTELANARDLTDSRSKAGATGAAKRWQTDGKPHGKRMASGMANHIATDRPSPSPKESPLPPTGGKVVVDAFLEARRHHWPHEGDERLVLLTLQAQADQYIADGASSALIGEVMEKAMSQMAKAGKGPPMNLRFCHRSMADAIVATKRPPPSTNNGHAANGFTPPLPPERSPIMWRSRLERWLADKLWMPSWLIDDCPTELLDEYAARLNAKPPFGYKFSQYYIDRQPPPQERDRTFETP